MKLALHIGLHKTGTTSLQTTCTNARSMLAENGVCYPADTKLTHGGEAHHGAARLLQRGHVDRCLEVIAGTARGNPGCSLMLLSTEEFCNFFGTEANVEAARTFISGLRNIFEQIDVYCVIRHDPALIRSTVREYIEAVGMPY